MSMAAAELLLSVCADGRLCNIPVHFHSLMGESVDCDALCRPASGVAVTTDEEDDAAAEAVRRSNRPRRPPAHLSSDDDYLGSDGELPSGDEKLPRHPNNFTNWPGTNGNLSDDSDQSCFGALPPLSYDMLVLNCFGLHFATDDLLLCSAELAIDHFRVLLVCACAGHVRSCQSGCILQQACPS